MRFKGVIRYQGSSSVVTIPKDIINQLNLNIGEIVKIKIEKET